MTDQPEPEKLRGLTIQEFEELHRDALRLLHAKSQSYQAICKQFTASQEANACKRRRIQELEADLRYWTTRDREQREYIAELKLLLAPAAEKGEHRIDAALDRFSDVMDSGLQKVGEALSRIEVRQDISSGGHEKQPNLNASPEWWAANGDEDGNL